MRPQTCPSCGHQIREKINDRCPFCGSEIGRSVTTAGSGSSRKNARAALVIASLVLMLAGGLFSYFLAGQEEAEVNSSVTSPTGRIPSSFDICQHHMTAVLNAQEDLYATRGRYASNVKELLSSVPELDVRCPMSGETYEMTIQGDVIKLVCPSHGLSQIR